MPISRADKLEIGKAAGLNVTSRMTLSTINNVLKSNQDMIKHLAHRRGIVLSNKLEFENLLSHLVNDDETKYERAIIAEVKGNKHESKMSTPKTLQLRNLESSEDLRNSTEYETSSNLKTRHQLYPPYSTIPNAPPSLSPFFN